MDVILIPGFWLRGDSWDGIAPALRDAGHTVHTPTLPGLESAEADRSEVTLRTHIDSVVALVDAIEAPVALVGHSGGGVIAYAVTDARPERISRVIYVDSGPLGEGDSINDQLPSDGADIPLPDWTLFDDRQLVGLTDELRAASVPARCRSRRGSRWTRWSSPAATRTATSARW
ncbi:alpha/beta fold hydrolase [Diaminobutyricimonas aerilata]|uniref:alpha/beta fold hydrolase n=1 Tax=Diaminobutyricimonas aerilata TaxID=1162967 RepID=UPI002680C087